MLETDSKTTTVKLIDLEKDMSIFGLLVEEMNGLLWPRVQFRVACVRRSASCVAHSLAKEGCMNKVGKSWFHVALVCILEA